MASSSFPPPSILSKIAALSGWKKFLIAMSPAMLAWGIVVLFIFLEVRSKATLPFLISLIFMGAALAGYLTALSLRARKPEAKAWVLILIFLAVALAYVSLNYAGCWAVVLLSF